MFTVFKNALCHNAKLRIWPVYFNIKKLSGKKYPRFDLITAEVIRNLPKKSILFLTQIYNAILRLSYFPIL